MYNSMKRKTHRIENHGGNTVYCTGGFTILEVVIAAAVLIVLVSGALAYQYHSSIDVKKAEVQAAAGRLGLLILDAWKGQGVVGAFNPLTAFGSDLNVTAGPDGPDADVGAYTGTFTLLGYYHVLFNNVNYYVTLSYRPGSAVCPTVLSVAVAWLGNYSAGSVTDQDKTIRLTTYADNE